MYLFECSKGAANGWKTSSFILFLYIYVNWSLLVLLIGISLAHCGSSWPLKKGNASQVGTLQAKDVNLLKSEVQKLSAERAEMEIYNLSFELTQLQRKVSKADQTDDDLIAHHQHQKEEFQVDGI